MTDVDYHSLDVPHDKPPMDYSWQERRAELLQLIEQAGHPRAINQSKLKDRYGVSQQQISQDIERIREYIVDTIDETRADALTETIYQTAIKKLMEQGDYRGAINAVESRNDWLFDRGKLDKEADKLQLSAEDEYIQNLKQANNSGD